MTTRWGDDIDDSDDELLPSNNVQQQQHTHTRAAGLLGKGKELKIPPTHYSRIDQQGIQIVTSYRANPNHSGQLIKTITKQKVTKEKIREPKAVEKRRQWKKFGQAAIDAKEGVQTTVQSKDEIKMENPHADKDLQDEDPAQAIAGNINAFWAKQQRRQLERKFDVGAPTEGTDEDGNSGWTQVAAKGTASATGATGATGTGKYLPPAARAGASAGTGVGSSLSALKRQDDLNTIRVTNLSDSTTEADLQDLFQAFGRVSRVYLAKDKETMQSRGFAFVSFVNQAEAARAMEELQGHGFDHLILKLEWARPTAPKDPATSGTEFRSGYGKALAQDTKAKVSYASNLTK